MAFSTIDIAAKTRAQFTKDEAWTLNVTLKVGYNPQRGGPLKSHGVYLERQPDHTEHYEDGKPTQRR
ncbi:hypothetical protein RRG08_034086 [Elysia crispata]|uniref:Uncharacterized protein n=1 Tax=Elysia crispata TaxID=231223 RepID=A0AAE0YTU7_9GAST|nr:hypothetical protein RRG08_034086 [Elysia crispata]